MYHTMYHTSPNEIKEGTINNYGVADDCLFFSDKIYVMTPGSYYVYEASFNKVIEAYELEDEEIVNEIAERINCDKDLADDLLKSVQRAEWWMIENNRDPDGENMFWLQGKRGECAKKMGFDGCLDVDEQGSVYIVPMSGRESELKFIEVVGE